MKRLFKQAALVMGALLGLCANAQSIKIGTLPLNHQLPMYAQEAGLFKKHGLDVEVKLVQSGPALVQAVLAGEFVGGSFGPIPLLNLAARGVPMYALAMDGYHTPQHPAGAIMVRPDETGIKSFSDLKGKAVGQLAVGTLTYMRLFTAAEQYGMKRSDFREVFVPFPQMGQLLNSKQVDAVYSWPPYDTLMIKARQGKVLADDTAWSPYAVAAMLHVSKDWADKNPETVKRLVKAYIEAGRWASDNPAEARRIAAKWMGLSDEVARDMRLLYWPRNGYVMLPSIWDQYHMMVKTGQIKPLDNPAAMIDAYYVQPALRFVAPALKELGLQPDTLTNEMLKIKLPYLEGDLSKYQAPWQQ